MQKSNVCDDSINDNTHNKMRFTSFVWDSSRLFCCASSSAFLAAAASIHNLSRSSNSFLALSHLSASSCSLSLIRSCSSGSFIRASSTASSCRAISFLICFLFSFFAAFLFSFRHGTARVSVFEGFSLGQFDAPSSAIGSAIFDSRTNNLFQNQLDVSQFIKELQGKVQNLSRKFSFRVSNSIRIESRKKLRFIV